MPAYMQLQVLNLWYCDWLRSESLVAEVCSTPVNETFKNAEIRFPGTVKLMNVLDPFPISVILPLLTVIVCVICEGVCGKGE